MSPRAASRAALPDGFSARAPCAERLKRSFATSLIDPMVGWAAGVPTVAASHGPGQCLRTQHL
jgi:hypothetical protein